MNGTNTSELLKDNLYKSYSTRIDQLNKINEAITVFSVKKGWQSGEK